MLLHKIYSCFQTPYISYIWYFSINDTNQHKDYLCFSLNFEQGQNNFCVDLCR